MYNCELRHEQPCLVSLHSGERKRKTGREEIKLLCKICHWPCLISSSARWVLQLNIAVCNGVLSSAVFARMSALCRSKVRQISRSPFMQTRCRAVIPTCVLALTSISVSRTNRSTMSLLRLRTAWCRAVLFNESTSDALAPELRRTSATAGQLNLKKRGKTERINGNQP